jgi:hypothetical protein
MQVDVENAFNSVFQAVIFKKLCDAKRLLASIIPFTKLFYGAHFFLLLAWAACGGDHHY